MADTKVYLEGMKAPLGNGFNGLVVLDEERNILRFSESTERITGWKAEDAIGRYCREVFSSIGCDEVCPTKEVFKDGEPHSVELSYTPPQSDQRLTLMITATPMFDKAGKVIASVELIKDITETKRLVRDLEKARAILEKKVAERTAALKESEKRYRDLVEDISDGYFVLQDGKFVFANKAFCGLSGYTAAETIGTSLAGFIDPESLADVVRNCQSGLEGKPAPAEYELEATHKDGYRIWVEIRAKAAQYEGKAALIGILRDITEKKRMEKEMKDKIEELERFTRIAVDREERMNELKQKIKSLEERLKAKGQE